MIRIVPEGGRGYHAGAGESATWRQERKADRRAGGGDGRVGGGQMGKTGGQDGPRKLVACGAVQRSSAGTDVARTPLQQQEYTRAHRRHLDAALTY